MAKNVHVRYDPYDPRFKKLDGLKNDIQRAIAVSLVTNIGLYDIEGVGQNLYRKKFTHCEYLVLTDNETDDYCYDNLLAEKHELIDTLPYNMSDYFDTDSWAKEQLNNRERIEIIDSGCESEEMIILNNIEYFVFAIH